MNKAENIAHYFGRPLTDDEIREIGRLRRKGWGYRRIARAINRNEYTVRGVIRGNLSRYIKISGLDPR